MPDRTYSVRDLIIVYAETQRGHYIHEDFKLYYASLLEKLEQSFNITLSPRGALGMLFNAYIRAYLATFHPRAGFLEDSLINIKLLDAGEKGMEIFKLERELGNLIDQTKELQMQILIKILEVIHGQIDKTVTSEELLVLGLDDSLEPNIRNYYNYL